MSSQEAPKNQQMTTGSDVPMPVGWSQVNKVEYGMTNNILLLIAACFTFLCFLVCVAEKINIVDKSKHKTAMKYTTLAAFLVAAVGTILEGFHMSYESNIGYSILPQDVWPVPIAMISLIAIYFFIAYMCSVSPDMSRSSYCNLTVSLSVFAAIAGGVLFHFVHQRMMIEESFMYKNLEEPVPEMKME